MLYNLKYGTSTKRILVIDGTNAIIRAVSVAEKYKLELYGLFFKTISTVIKKFKPFECYLVFDGQGGNTIKRTIFSEYKLQRNNVTKLQTQDYNKLFSMLTHTPIITIRMNNIEGDDVIGHIVRKNQNRGHKIVICSSDKDFYQLCSETVQVWNPIKKVLMTKDMVIQKYNCHPINFPIYKSLIGDSSDNIPGIKGIGQKTILKYFGNLFKEVQPLNGNMNDFLQYIEKELPHSDMKLRMLEHIVDLKKYWKIVNLRNGTFLSPQLGSVLDQLIENKKKNLNFDKQAFLTEAKKHGIKSEDLVIIYPSLHFIIRR